MQITKVCQLPGEAQFLRAAIADFSNEGPRAQYATWLTENGDPHRSEDVRNTIRAYQTLDPGPLARLSGQDDWLRMIGAPILEKFISEASKFEREKMLTFRDLVFCKLRPGLALDYRPAMADPPLGTSRLWGLPDLPKTEKWPTIDMASNWFDAKDNLPGEDHCAFLGQFVYQDFNGTLLGEDMPQSGGFSVFTITEVHKYGTVETVILPWDNRAELERKTAPVDLLKDRLGDKVNAPHPVHDILLKEVLSLPDPTDGPFKSVIPDCGWSEPYGDFYYELEEACGENLTGFGGYLRGTSGGDPSPNTQAIRVAVLRTNPDVGIVHFSIPADDLPKGRLDRVQYVWCDWDS